MLLVRLYWVGWLCQLLCHLVAWTKELFQAHRHTAVILPFGRWGHGGLEFKASLDYMRHYFKRKTKQKGALKEAGWPTHVPWELGGFPAGLWLL